MCELLGVSSAEYFLANDYLKAFFSHSDSHPHGWGMACASGNGTMIEKESVKASDSNYLRERLSQPVISKTILAHIRYATIGNVEYRNCHPFSGFDGAGRQWTLIHNGTIFDFPPLKKYIWEQRGETDSERILLYLLDSLKEEERSKGGRLRFEDRFGLFDRILCAMSEGNKLNLLFTDGKYLFAHTNYRDSLFYRTDNNRVTISTQPLDDGYWQNIPFCQLTAFEKGKLIRAGTAHGHEYIEDKEAVKLLYQIFANL